MEDDKETEETPTRGNDWEVVSLTASAYAAAPGSDAFESPEPDNNDAGKEEDEVSRAMFMSGHFVFPPNQHENLPLEPAGNEIDVEVGSENEPVEGDRFECSVAEGLTHKEKEIPEDVQGVEFFDNGKNTEFGDTAHNYTSMLAEPEPDVTAPTVCDEVAVERNVDSSSDSSKSLSPTKRNTSKGCDAWWKRQAASFYAQAKEANAFWSVFVAAALMGIVIIGQRWQQERWQNLQSNIGDEKVNRMMGPLSRFKDVLVGGHRQGSVIRGSASTER